MRLISHWWFYLFGLNRSFIVMIRRSLRPICFYCCLDLNLLSIVCIHFLPGAVEFQGLSWPQDHLKEYYIRRQKVASRLLIVITARRISPGYQETCVTSGGPRAKPKLTTWIAHSVNKHLTSPPSIRCVQMQVMRAGGVERVWGIMNVSYQGDQTMFETRGLILTVQERK